MRNILYLIIVAIIMQTVPVNAKKGPDYYKIMGLKKDATDDQIKKAFKKQAIKYHPDKNPDDPEGAKIKF